MAAKSKKTALANPLVLALFAVIFSAAAIIALKDQILAQPTVAGAATFVEQNDW